MTISLPPKGNAAKVLESYFSPLRVQAQAIPAMTCHVAEGTFWTADHTHKEYFGGTTPQIFPTLPILGAPTSKWVLVTVTKDGVLNTIDGDAVTTAPVLPLPETYLEELPLAAIFVQDDTAVITNEMIFDIRPLWSVPIDAISPADLANFATILYVDDGLNTKADTDGTNSYTFTLGDGISSHNNTALIINRLGNLADVSIIFNEDATVGSPPVSDPRWEFTNDGMNWETLGVASGNYYTKAAADDRFVNVIHLDDDVLHITPTQNEFLDGLTLGSPNLSADDVNQLIGITGNVQAQIDADVLNLSSHMADLDVHMDADQNAFFDGLTLTGSPALSAADVNQLIGITGNVQVLLDLKLDTTVYNAHAADTTIHFSTLNGLSNVSISGSPSLADNDLLQYNSVTTDWENVVPSDVFGADYVRKTGNFNETIDGIKTFSEGIIVAGTNATFQTANLNVDDTNITLNFSYADPSPAPSHGGGLTVNRGSVEDAASLIWDDANGYWSAGLVGSEAEIVTKGEARTQPFYELAVGIGGSPLGAVYELGFDVPMPTSSATAAVQVFVNGIKQIEGAGKAYTVTYGGSPVAVIVTFETGSEPSAGADVEFYGFGYLA